MSEIDLKKEITHLVRVKDHVTFVEIKKHLSDKMPVNGCMAVTMPNDPNLVLWAGLSQKLADTITELLNEKEIFLHPADLLIYIVDGALPCLPIAKQPPSGGYKRPHWLPVCFRTVPCKPTARKIHRNTRFKKPGSTAKRTSTSFR